MCVFNGEDVVREQLDALASQKVDFSWELVVVNNRSTDSTRDVLDGVASSFPIPLAILDANGKQGAGYARNRGAIASRGRFLAFCDADDRVGDGWLRAAHRGLADSELVGGPLRELRDPFEAGSPILAGAHLHENSFGVSIPSGNFAVRRSTYFEIGGFDESFPPCGMEDVEFSARANRGRVSIAVVPDMTVYFRPTRSITAILRKTYLSGQAESLLWSRYPDVFRDPGIWNDANLACRRVASAVRNLVQTRESRHVRTGIRSAVTFGGHVVARVKQRMGAGAPAPILLSSADDTQR